MAYHINPAFHRPKRQATIIGRILAAFGELEYQVVIAAGRASKNFYPVLKALYRLRSTTSRIEAADALIRPFITEIGLLDDWSATLGSIRYCMRIRNQYAHCNWGDQTGFGLFFADLEESADAADGWEHHWYHVNVPLLKRQEEYFVYAQGWLYFLEYRLCAALKWTGIPEFPRPEALERPPLHAPASRHVPPWLSEDLKARHLERVRKAEESAAPRARPPSVPKLSAAQKRAKALKDARRAAKPTGAR